MLDYIQKRKARSFLYNKITLGFLFLVLLFAVHSTWGVYKKKVESEELKQISLRSVEELRKRDIELEEKLSRLNTEAGLEKEIRSKFSVAKEGERAVVIVEEKNEVSTTSPEYTGFWRKFLNLFKN